MPVRLNPSQSFRDLFAGPEAPAATRPVVGMFVCDGGATSAEICAGAGFDYVLIDAEHGAFWLESIQNQLRAVAGYPAQAVVRVPVNDEVPIKQVLDAGAQNIMVPMVHDAVSAASAVRSVRYPQPGAPESGARGVGAALARSSRWGRIPDYLARAHELVSLIVQIESAEAVANAGEIAEVDGVDALFIGPSDLAASMGYLGQQGHPEVVAAVHSVIAAAKAAGKIVGVNAFDPKAAREYLVAGADFVNVGADVALLARATEKLADDYLG
jgi:4-hydroxy-2-oxoheptanedioate aldolase